MNERRRERLSAFIRDELAKFFQEGLELEPGVFISIQYVEVLKSASRANVFLSIFPDIRQYGVAKKLKILENKATRFIQDRLSSKHSPMIRFLIVENGPVVK